jgi:cytochrome c-type biogenesis protein CcmH/NrfG
VRALDYGVRARAGDPSNADLRNLLGHLYFSQGQAREAVQEYQAAVELDPERPEFKMNLEAARKRLP